MQQLRRRWQHSRSEDDYEAYRVARNNKGRYVKSHLRDTHRLKVEEASKSDDGLWKLVKWAKNRHYTTSICTPALHKPNGELAIDVADKAETLRQLFFPPPLTADLSDIDHFDYLNPIECPEITSAEVEKAIRKAAPDKAPGADDIPNRILQ